MKGIKSSQYEINTLSWTWCYIGTYISNINSKRSLLSNWIRIVWFSIQDRDLNKPCSVSQTVCVRRVGCLGPCRPRAENSSAWRRLGGCPPTHLRNLTGAQPESARPSGSNPHTSSQKSEKLILDTHLRFFFSKVNELFSCTKIKFDKS